MTDLLKEARFLAGHCRWLMSHDMEDDEDDSAFLGSLSSILDKLADEIEMNALQSPKTQEGDNV